MYIPKSETFEIWTILQYRKDTEHLYHAFVYSLVSFLSGIYPLLAMHSLLVTSLYQGVHITCFNSPDFEWSTCCVIGLTV